MTDLFVSAWLCAAGGLTSTPVQAATASIRSMLREPIYVDGSHHKLHASDGSLRGSGFRSVSTWDRLSIAPLRVRSSFLAKEKSRHKGRLKQGSVGWPTDAPGMRCRLSPTAEVPSHTSGAAMGLGRAKTQNALKRDENDILKFDFEIEWARDPAPRKGPERLTCSIAIERPRVFTQPGPTTDIIGALDTVNSLYEEPFFSCRQGGGSPPPAATGSPSPVRAVSEQHLHAVLSLVRRTGRQSSVPLSSRPQQSIWSIPKQCWPEAFPDGLLSRWSSLSN
jgi:hypothetical protein